MVIRETWAQAGKSKSLISCHCQKAGKLSWGQRPYFKIDTKLFLACKIQKVCGWTKEKKVEMNHNASIKVLGGKMLNGRSRYGHVLNSNEWRVKIFPKGYVRALLSVSARHSLTSARAWMIPERNRKGAGRQKNKSEYTWDAAFAHLAKRTSKGLGKHLIIELLNSCGSDLLFILCSYKTTHKKEDA